MSVSRRYEGQTTNGRAFDEPVSFSTEPDRILGWIMETIGTAQSAGFDDVVERLQARHPDLPQEDIRIGIWTLLSEGDLELRLDRGLTRA